MYPGDQGNSGGEPSRQPPHTPYGPGAEVPPYGRDNDEAPFAPRAEGPGAGPFGGRPSGGEPFGGEPFGGGSFGGEPFGGPADQTAAAGGGAWGDEPVAGNAHGAFPAGPPGPPGGFGDHYGPGEGGPPMPSDAPPRPEKRRNLPLIIGAAAVAGLVLIGGGIGLSSVLKGDSEEEAKPSRAAATPTPTPTPTKPVLTPVKLKTRATDPKPLTLKEVFGNGKFNARGHKYVRTAVNHKRSCTAAVGGKELEKYLKAGDCTQALRATYALTGGRLKGQLIGSVGVFNLKSEAAAKLAVKAAADDDAFLQALPGKKGISKTNGRGEALGTSQARGHYLLMTWVQRPDGKRITKKYHSAVRVFGAEMVKGSNLAVALHYRETEGKPLQK
ncbi:hypothetical protein E1281_34435 [Actinomadura sp. KC345]|uniref:hypothetical protein n=1 Tax=Actinomadura sp. KC345 TaxID=2530371 RepID=UPI00104E06C2|nr:hypothetical protein [Actinomadura sp. KC345]TDC44181.1 hypothetical protein E1281_34435 [Actinomadura sp. KC345]